MMGVFQHKCSEWESNMEKGLLLDLRGFLPDCLNGTVMWVQPKHEMSRMCEAYLMESSEGQQLIGQPLKWSGVLGPRRVCMGQHLP
jgi:hypothetical protein